MRFKAVFFDAVGTLIHPDPSPGEVYERVGRQFGSSLERPEIVRRFRAAFAHEEEADRRAGWATDEARERLRWQNIVAQVLDDVSDPSACFDALYEHFAQSHAWRCDPAMEEFLERLSRQGVVLGLASNYDHRLRRVVDGLAPLRVLEHLLISSEIGWRKPASQFFEAMRRRVELPAESILYIGDDRVNDYDGALAAGMHAILVDKALPNLLSAL